MALFIAIVLLVVSFAAAYISDTIVSKTNLDSVDGLLFGISITSFIGAVVIVVWAFVKSFS